MNKIIIFLIISIQLFATSTNDFINISKCDQIIDKQVFQICYDYKLKGAKAVWYQLDGQLVNAVNIKDRPKFYTEKNLPVKYRSKSSDYIESGYDRGHIASDASFDYNEKALSKTYTMANIIPQAFYDKTIYTHYII